MAPSGRVRKHFKETGRWRREEDIRAKEKKCNMFHCVKHLVCPGHTVLGERRGGCDQVGRFLSLLEKLIIDFKKIVFILRPGIQTPSFTVKKAWHDANECDLILIILNMQ